MGIGCGRRSWKEIEARRLGVARGRAVLHRVWVSGAGKEIKVEEGLWRWKGCRVCAPGPGREIEAGKDCEVMPGRGGGVRYVCRGRGGRSKLRMVAGLHETMDGDGVAQNR